MELKTGRKLLKYSFSSASETQTSILSGGVRTLLHGHEPGTLITEKTYGITVFYIGDPDVIMS
jgi:hypothetical protein